MGLCNRLHLPQNLRTQPLAAKYETSEEKAWQLSAPLGVHEYLPKTEETPSFDFTTPAKRGNKVGYVPGPDFNYKGARVLISEKSKLKFWKKLKKEENKKLLYSTRMTDI